MDSLLPSDDDESPWWDDEKQSSLRNDEKPWWETINAGAENPANAANAANAAILLINNNRVLLVEVGDGVWQTPGGKIDHGEGAFEAAKREFREETGWRGTTFNVVASVNYRKHTQLYICKHEGACTDTRNKTKETRRQKWFQLDALPKMRTCDYQSLQYLILQGKL